MGNVWELVFSILIYVTYKFSRRLSHGMHLIEFMFRFPHRVNHKRYEGIYFGVTTSGVDFFSPVAPTATA